MNINTCRVSELNKQNINVKNSKQNCRLMFKDILTFLELDYRDDLLVHCFPRNQYSKIRIIIMHKNLLLKKLKINICKMDVRTFWKRL